MNKILNYLIKFYADYFSWGEFSVALIFLIGFCFCNYYKYIPYFSEELSLLQLWWYTAYFADYKFSFHFMLYLSPLVFGYLMSSLFHKEWHYWKNPKFLFLMTFGVAAFAFHTNLAFYIQDILSQLKGYEHLDWMTTLSITLGQSVFLFLVFFMFWLIVDRKHQPFYGFTIKNIEIKPYFIMLLIMLPLIAAASTQEDFLTSYPTVQQIVSLDFANPEHWTHFSVYEILYGLDFFSIEFFFRGFMILAFVGIVGPKAIMPMAYIYLVAHWNKPMGELISSFFGGTFLGIVTYYSRSIIGGIIVHVGIAWMMEIGAFISKYLYP